MDAEEAPVDDPQMARWHEAARLYKVKRSLRAVAAEMGVDESAVRGYLTNIQVPRARRGRPKKDVPDELIVCMRECRNWSWSKIAEKTGLGRTTVVSRYSIARNGHRTGRDTPAYLQADAEAS
jgi:hypothetical protein